jgi:hypothetical protein
VVYGVRCRVKGVVGLGIPFVNRIVFVDTHERAVLLRRKTGPIGNEERKDPSETKKERTKLRNANKHRQDLEG